MQYDTIEELMLELSLYPNKKIDILEDCAGKCKYGWFTVAKDGNCALFDNNGELDDISKVKSINSRMILKDIENIIIPDSVTSIGNDAFYNCTNLMSVTIPNSITSIVDGMFAECGRLMSVMIPDSVTCINDCAFFNCSGLTNVTIPNSVKSIRSYVFHGCSKLTNVTIPDSVMNIGQNAFNDCSGLTNVTIGNGVTSIGWRAFFNCKNLKELIFKGKTIEEVKSMKKYPWGIQDESIIKCER